MRARQRHTLASKQHSRTSSLRGRAQLGQLAGLRKQAPSCSWVRKAAAHRRRPTMHSRRRSISASLAPPMVPLETSQPNTLKPLGLRQGQRLLQPALTSQGPAHQSRLLSRPGRLDTRTWSKQTRTRQIPTLAAHSVARRGRPTRAAGSALRPPKNGCSKRTLTRLRLSGMAGFLLRLRRTLSQAHRLH